MPLLSLASATKQARDIGGTQIQKIFMTDFCMTISVICRVFAGGQGCIVGHNALCWDSSHCRICQELQCAQSVLEVTGLGGYRLKEQQDNKNKKDRKTSDRTDKINGTLGDSDLQLFMGRLLPKLYHIA